MIWIEIKKKYILFFLKIFITENMNIFIVYIYTIQSTNRI